jgi:hypothetical protein
MKNALSILLLFLMGFTYAQDYSPSKQSFIDSLNNIIQDKSNPDTLVAATYLRLYKPLKSQYPDTIFELGAQAI